MTVLQFSWCCLVVCTVVTTTASQRIPPYTGMWPNRLLVESGTTLELNCTLPGDSLGTPQRVEDIYFRFNATSFPATDVADAGTATLLMPGARRDMTGNWSCLLPGTTPDTLPATIGHQMVTIADLPTKPTITGCIVYNWMSMTCRWEPKVQDTGIPTNQTLYWTLLRDGSYNWCPIIDIQNATCTWPSGDGTGGDNMRPAHSYHLYVIANNRLGSARSDIFSQNTGAVGRIVMPNPVGNLQFAETGQTYVVLQWKAPFIKKRILYKINYDSAPGETNMTAKSKTEAQLVTVNITGLEPYTMYSFNINCIPWAAKQAIGFWSKSQHISVRTNESVPSSSPGISPGGFKTSDDQGHRRSADIYWQSVREADRRGEVVGYRVRYWDVVAERWHESVSVSGANTARLSLAKERAYQVVVDARTGAGFNPNLNLTRLHIEKESDMPAKLTKVVAQLSPDAHLVLMSWSPTEGATRYTVYWCKGSSQVWSCEGELKWAVVPENTTSLNVSLNDQQYKHFIFGVSAEFHRVTNGTTPGTYLVSSGLMWSQCTHPADKPVSPPQNVGFSENQKPESITVEWTNPRCENTVYIDKYIIYYCPVTECKEGSEEARHLQVDGGQEVATITAVRPTVEYRVWMKGSSRLQGLSVPTQPLTIRVHASGLPKGAIAGIVIVGILVTVLIMYGIYQFVKCFKKKFKEKLNIRFEPPPDVILFPDNKYDDQDLQNYQTLLDQDSSRTTEQSTPHVILRWAADCPTEAARSRATEGYLTAFPLQPLAPSRLLCDLAYLSSKSSGGTHACSSGTLSSSDTLQTLLQADSSNSKNSMSDVSSSSCMQPLGIVPEEDGVGNATGPMPCGDKTPTSPNREMSGASQRDPSSPNIVPGYSKCGISEKGGKGEKGEAKLPTKRGACNRSLTTLALPSTSCIKPQSQCPSRGLLHSGGGSYPGSPPQEPASSIELQVAHPEGCLDSSSGESGGIRTDSNEASSPPQERRELLNRHLVGNGISPRTVELEEMVPQHTAGVQELPGKSINSKHDRNNAYILDNSM